MLGKAFAVTMAILKTTLGVKLGGAVLEVGVLHGLDIKRKRANTRHEQRIIRPPNSRSPCSKVGTMPEIGPK